MDSRRNIFIFAGLVALLFGIFMTLRNATHDMARDRVKKAIKDVKAKAKDEMLDVLANASASGAELSGPDEQGRPLWSVGAAKSQVRTDADGTSHITMTGARATLYKDGQPQTRLQGAKMEMTRTPDERIRLALSGGVTATTVVPATVAAKSAKIGASGPVVLTTPRADINVTTRRLIAAGGVTMTQGQGAAAVLITAPRLDADVALATAQISGGVVAKAPQGTVRAPKATLNWQSGRVTADGGVTAQHEDTTLTGARLDADIRGKSGTLSGGVTARSSQGRAQAQSVNYNWSANRLTALGGVALTQGDGTLRAARIECDNGLQNAVASGGVTLRKGDMSLRAARAEATRGMARASASGDVLITKGDVSVRAARVDSFDDFARATAQGSVLLTKGDTTLRAGHVEVLNRATSATAYGGVTLHQGDLTVTAARANATNLGDKKALRVVASGGVAAHNPSGTVHAANVTWGGGRITATGSVRAQRADLALSANRFDADDAGHKADLTGNVVVKHPNGSSLHAPHARYDKGAGKKGKIWADGGIEFRDAGGGVLHGKSLVADLNLKQAHLSGVDGTVSVKTLQGKDLF